MIRNGQQAPELANLQVVNRHTYSGPRDNSYVYIGRGTPLGNNWSHVPNTAAQYQAATREEAVERFRQQLWKEVQSGKGPALQALEQLKGRAAKGENISLVCSCSPQLCHGDVVKSAIEHLVERDRQRSLQNQTQTQEQRDTIFISGSRSIKALPSEARDNLDRYIRDGNPILVGDAPGVDALVQRYLFDRSYQDVKVCHIGNAPRNNLGFGTIQVHGTKQIDKDAFMAGQADRGLAIWDGRSPGTKTNIARLETTIVNVTSSPVSARGQQAQSDVLSHTASDNYHSFFTVPEGLTRGEHASKLNQSDQFIRDAFERGATIADNVLALPTDPDSRPQDGEKVRIGTESHAIHFVRGFISDPQAAREKGQRLYELGNKACGEWTDSHGRYKIFSQIYNSIRKDENNAYRSNEAKAEAIDRVLAETAQWAEQLPQPIPEPTAEEVHEFTLALAEESRNTPYEPEPEEALNIDPASERDPRLLYLQELQSNSHGLATIGELTGFLSSSDFTSTQDESQVYGELFESAVSDAIELAIPEGDHLGVDHQAGSSGPTLDASFDRINLDALPPQLPDLTQENERYLLDSLLPTVDAQIESGFSRREILAPIYEANRLNESERFQQQVQNAFSDRSAVNDSDRNHAPSREDQINALSALRLLVAGEYRRETRSFSKDAIEWARGNYRLDPDQLRAAGKLKVLDNGKVSEYAKLAQDQQSARTQWIQEHPGQEVPFRSQIQWINQLEMTGHKINNRIAVLTPSRAELLQALDRIEARLMSARLSTESRLTAFAGAEERSGQLTLQAKDYAAAVRASESFQTVRDAAQRNDHERSLDESQALNRGNNARFDYLQQTQLSASQQPYPGNDPDSAIAQVDADREYERSQRNEPLPAEFSDPASNPILEEHLYDDQRPLQDPVFYIPDSGTIIEPGVVGNDGVVRGDYTNQTIEEIRERHPDVFIGEKATVEADLNHSEARSSNYPELTGESRPLSRFAETRADNETERKSEVTRLSHKLLNPDLESDKRVNSTELQEHQHVFTQLAGREVSTSAEARAALQPVVSNLTSMIEVADNTRTRLDASATIPDLAFEPTPIFVSLTSNESLRIPVATLPEFDALTNAIHDCRLETSTWRSLHSPAPITGRDEERDEITQFIGQYVDFRLPPGAHDSTSLLNSNSVFRGYAQRLNDARTSDELIKTASAIRSENFAAFKQMEEHRANPATVSAPDRTPLDVSQMRELFLSMTPLAKDNAQSESMCDVLHSMTLFGQQKAERVELLATGKLEPSPALQKLLANLEPRNTQAALRHFYRSITNPASTLERANSFDLYKTYRSLSQIERDYLYQHALAAKYEALKEKSQTVTSAQSKDIASEVHELSQNTIAPNGTGAYREYYGQADMREARGAAQILATQSGISSAALDRSSIAPEFSDLEVRAISYVVNNFDTARQSQTVEHLRASDDPRDQLLGDMISIAGDFHSAGVQQEVTAADIRLPDSYPLSVDSVQQVVSYAVQDRSPALTHEDLAAARENAQRVTWQDLQQNVLKDPSLVVDAPVATFNEIKDLHIQIESMAQLHDRARTAFAVRDSHFKSCVQKASDAIRSQLSTESKHSNNPDRDITSDLVRLALDPKAADSKGLLKSNAPQFNLVRAALTTSDIDKASQLQTYATSARNDYLQSFVSLDRAQQNVRGIEGQLSATRSLEFEKASQQAPTARDRYTTVKDSVEQAILGEHLQHSLSSNEPLSLGREASENSTTRDLIPVDVKLTAAAEARDQAWKSFEPQELRDAAAGHPVDDRILNLAYGVMDQVDSAQRLELGARQSETQLNAFVDEKMGEREAAIRDERATTTYESSFRQLTSESTQDQERDPIDSPQTEDLQLLRASATHSTDISNLVAQAQNGELPAPLQQVVMTAHTEATIQADTARQQPLYASTQEREEAKQTTIAELKGPDALRYEALHQNLEKSEAKLDQGFKAIDGALTELSQARTELRMEQQLSQYQKISAPVAQRVNDYLKETTREEGLKALIDPVRTDEHVEKVAMAILETAQQHNVTLDHSTAGIAQVQSIATNLFDSLRDGMERANAHLFEGRELSAELYRSDLAITPTLDHQLGSSLGNGNGNGHHQAPQISPTLTDNHLAAPNSPVHSVDTATSHDILLADNPFLEIEPQAGSELADLTKSNISTPTAQANTPTGGPASPGPEIQEQALELVL
jgi:adenine-specific DNA-methyltransferase